MELKRGRLIDHLDLRTTDLAASRKFYAAILDVLGIPLIDGGDHFFADELWVDAGNPASHVHFAFQAPDRATVDHWYAAGLSAGGRDNGGPGSANTIPVTTPLICWTPTATTSKRCITGQANALRMR